MQADTGYMTALNTLATGGTITTESAIEELKARDIFKTEVEAGDPVELGGGDDWNKWGH